MPITYETSSNVAGSSSGFTCGTPERRARAVEILSRHSGRDVHVHSLG
jgi:hypothetical protein